MGFTFSGGHYVPWVTNPIDDLRRASGLLSFLAILTERRLWLDGSRKPYEVVLQLPFGLLPSQGQLTSYRSFPPYIFDFWLRWRLIDLITENPGTPGSKRKADTVSLLRADEPVLQISALSSRLVPPRLDGI
jgi:hypothetical protein